MKISNTSILTPMPSPSCSSLPKKIDLLGISCCRNSDLLCFEVLCCLHSGSCILHDLRKEERERTKADLEGRKMFLVIALFHARFPRHNESCK